MMDEKSAFNVMQSVKKHIETLKPLLPKQALVCIGEYPIKILFKEPFDYKTDELPSILLGKSSDEIYKWIPKGFDPFMVLGFEDANIDTHFWYNVLPFVSRDETLVEGLKKKPIEKLRSAIMVASLWDGIGSAALPALASKFKDLNMVSLSMTILPSKVQLGDAYFNTIASLGMCASSDGAAFVLLDRDLIESFEGVDREGSVMKGNMVANYLVNMLLAKETLSKKYPSYQEHST